ncbi:unnamed protein product [Clavelina lepadiformis]|uniref:Uncharacterized protein n=1 Tax=Clavelina lepadiformis TaxID=159417 RepID=A0ABP0FUG9_CLALP
MFAKDAPIDSELASCKVMKKLDEMEIAWTETQKESMKTKLKERIKKKQEGGRFPQPPGGSMHPAFSSDQPVNPGIIIEVIIHRGQKPKQKYLDDVESSLKDKPEDLDIFKFLKDIMVRCWDFKEKNRPGIQQAVSTPSTSTTVQSRIRTTKDIINELQLHAPEGMKKKEKRVKMNGSILTNEEFNEQVENFEANGTIAKKRKAGRRKRNADEDEEINLLDLEEEEEIERRMEREIQRQMDEDMRRVDTEDEMVEESDDESEEMNDKTREDTVVRMEDVEEERRDVTEESVNEQKKEKRKFKLEINKKQVGKYFAVFWEKPKTYYWGKLLKVFRDEVDGKIEQAEFKFWDKKSTSEDAVYWDWQTKEDIDIVTV